MDHLDHHFLVRKLYKAFLYCLYGALHIRLNDNRKLLHIACLDLAEQIIQGQAGLGVLKQLVLALCDKCLRIASGFFLVFCSHQHISGSRHIV